MNEINVHAIHETIVAAITEGGPHDAVVTFGDLVTIADKMASWLDYRLRHQDLPAPIVEPEEEGEGVYLVEVFGEGGLARGTVFICASLEAAKREAERGITDYYGNPLRWTTGHEGYWEGTYNDGPHEMGSVAITLMEVIA